MAPDKSNDTEVQRMLALKRHEQPPPAFFQGFSEKVIDRIHSAGPAPRLTWRERLSAEFYGVPIYVCAAGVVVVGLLIAGLIGSLRVESPAAKTPEPSHAIVPPATIPTIKPPDVPQSRSALPPTRATLAIPESTPRPENPAR